MKNVTATGPDNLREEVCKSLGRTGVNFLKETLNKVTDEQKIPDIWRKSILIPIFKNKGDIMNCGNYRGIKPMCHSMKVYERVHQNRLRNIASEEYILRMQVYAVIHRGARTLGEQSRSTP